MSNLLANLVKTQPAFHEGRLRSLYSDFGSQRSTNPDGFQANVKAWESALVSAARLGFLGPDRFVVCFGSELQHLLHSREYGLPQGLRNVEEEGTINKHLVPLDTFLKTTASFALVENARLTDLPMKALTWAFNQVGLSQKAQVDPNHRYVPLKAVERSSEGLMSNLRQRTRRLDRILTIADFREIAANALALDGIADIDLAIFLKYLSRDRQLICYNDTTVKVRTQDDHSSTIEVEDAHISRLKAVLSETRAELATINLRVIDLQAKAREAVASQRKSQALSILKSKRLFESALVKRNDMLNQLEELLLKIGEAADQVEIVKVMEGSTKVLRALNKESGGIDHVDSVLDELHEELTKAEEINAAIGSDLKGQADLDDTEIDEELQRLELEAKAQERQEQVRGQLEDVPSLDHLRGAHKVPQTGGLPVSNKIEALHT